MREMRPVKQVMVTSDHSPYFEPPSSLGGVVVPAVAEVLVLIHQAIWHRLATLWEGEEDETSQASDRPR